MGCGASRRLRTINAEPLRWAPLDPDQPCITMKVKHRLPELVPRRSRNGKVELFAYLCTFCNHWHASRNKPRLIG